MTPSDRSRRTLRPRLVLALVPLLTAGPAAAAAPAAEEPELRRVLELEGGAFLRGRTRRTEDGTWQAFAQGRWHDLPDVVRATPERALLEQAKDLARKAGGGIVARVALADWMARAGLEAEALEELDRVLREEPGQPAALRWLASPPPSLRVHAGGATADELLAKAAEAPPALRELCLARLAEVDPRSVLFERYREALASPASPGLRAAAARGLGRDFPGEELEGLCVQSVLDASAEARLEAALALGRAGEPAVIVPLVRALASRRAAVRENAIEALGRSGYPAAVEPLIEHLANLEAGRTGRAPAANVFVGRQMAFVQDFDVEVSAGVSAADPSVNVLTEGSVLDARVHGVSVLAAPRESESVRAALGRLTGGDPGVDAAAWRAWWRAQGADGRGGASLR
jgi:HEAT repeat protein